MIRLACVLFPGVNYTYVLQKQCTSIFFLKLNYLCTFVNNILKMALHITASVLLSKNLVKMASLSNHLWKQRSGDFYFYQIKALFNKLISH